MSIDRRTLLRRLAVAGILINLPLSIRQALAAGGKPISPGIYKLSGNVTLNGKAAAEGMLVKPGDTLVTGANSQAVYVIGQDAYLQRDHSTVNILGAATTTGLRILTGKLLSVFGKGDKKLQTNTATIGIRGTGCYIEADAKQTYLCLCYGVADVVPSNAPEKAQTLETNHHERPITIASGKDQPIAIAPMINHTDDELTLLEALVGRKPPFDGNITYRY